MTDRGSTGRLCAALVVGLLLPASALAKWGADTNAGEGPKLVESVRPALVEIVGADEAARPALVKKLAEGKLALDAVEALKRFRNPELRPLFLALLDHPDWHVRHRALFALESPAYRGPDVVRRAFDLLGHEERRMREKAAITCVCLWEKGADHGIDDAAGAVERLLAAEPDLHVRSCLEALLRRIRGKLTPRAVYTEHVEELPDGLLLTPFLSGMNTAGQVAPGYTKKGVSRNSGKSAAKLPPASRWTTPILGYGVEEVKGTSLQPFANLRGNGTVYHTGQDVGSSLDGAGFYACAEGVVRFVYSGSDMGTLFVLEHKVADGELVNVVYMHGGSQVYVEAGERVSCGQLIGTMGMGYSIENGGHFAHLHLGMYPGPFQTNHNFGYRSVKAGLADWHDPAEVLPLWMERTRPVVDVPVGLDASLDGALAALEKGDPGKAHALATKAAGSGPAGDAGKLKAAIEAGVDRAIAKAEGQRKAGYPQVALGILESEGKRFRKVPGSERLAWSVKEWKKDAAFARELEAEKALVKARKKADKLAGKKDSREEIRALYEPLLEKYGDTPLRARLERLLDRKPADTK